MINSKRGGGPKTSEGRLAASKNAIKTGAYSPMVVLPGESEEEFQGLLDQFIQDFSPQDIAEASMVRELAVLTWKRLRLEQIEHAETIRELSKPISEYDLSLGGVQLPEDCLWMLKDLPLLSSEYIQSYRDINKFIYEINRKAEISDELIAQFPDMCPDFVKRAFDLSNTIWVYDSLNTPWTVLAGFDYEFGGKKQSFVHFALKTLKSRATQVISISGMLQKIQDSFSAVKEKRIFKLMVSEKNNRVSEDLSRAFFKTLGELRRQQKWRKDIRTIDVSDAEADVE